MRRLTALVAMVLVATGCSTSGEGGENGSTDGTTAMSPAPAPSPTAHEAVDQPFELTLETPPNFEPTENDRGVLIADEHHSYDFHLVDGSEHSRLTVTTYLLPEDVQADDYDSRVALILEYDERRGNLLSPEKYSPTIVHGYEGVYRFASLDPNDKEISQQNHYLFAGRHLIQITCQWEYDFNAVYQGCQDLTMSFTYPEAWPLVHNNV